jgi:hypothetical protein
MTDFATIFSELADAIGAHGKSTVISDPVREVIDRYDMLDIMRGDGFFTEIDFGIRQGDQRIIGHFVMTPADEAHPARVNYDLELWAPKPDGRPGIQRRSWQWDIHFGQDPTFPAYQ